MSNKRTKVELVSETRVKKETFQVQFPKLHESFRSPVKGKLYDQAVEWYDKEDPTKMASISKWELTFAHRNRRASRPKVTFVREGGYVYEPNNWYVIFACKFLGGGFLRKGFVQEEIATLNFPEMAYLLINHYPGFRGRDKLPLEPNEVVIYEHLQQTNTCTHYGHLKEDSTPERILVQTNVTDVNFIAMDAPKTGKHHYTKKECIQIMMQKAIAGFQVAMQKGAKKIITGKWGAGAYGNPIKRSLITQYLAAWYVGLPEITFYLYDSIDDNTIEILTNSKYNYEELYGLVMEN